MEPQEQQEQYQNLTYEEAKRRLSERFMDPKNGYPNLLDVKAARSFDSDDHWQKGDGFIGQLPTGSDAQARTETLKKAFTPEDLISEVLDTHVQNVLGEDPIMALQNEAGEPAEDEVLKILNEWWEKRENTKVLEQALRVARRESASVLRAFIPSGMIDGEGRIEARDLTEALSKIWIRCELIEDAGVIIDEATATELGLAAYRMKVDKTDVSFCEYAYLKDDATMWGTKSAHNADVGEEAAEPLFLGGLLPIYELKAKQLITNSVCQAQRAINLSGTMLTRNNNLAGSRERLAVGVQPPGDWVESVGADGVTTQTLVPKEMPTGPSTFNFLMAQSWLDEEGVTKALANPNIIFTDPVPIDTFVGTSKHWRETIYGKAKMRHLMIADDATASGKSRVEARNEFRASTKESKQIVDAAGRWMRAIALNIAAHFIGKPGAYVELKHVFEAQLSTIELTPEEKGDIRANYKAGLIDLQTALEQLQYKNVEEIMERIAATPKPTPEAGE